MITAWTAIVEKIRGAGVPELDKMVDKYQAKLFSTDKTCWVDGARRAITRRAIELGVIEKDFQEGL